MTLRLINGFDYFPTGQSEADRQRLWSAAGLFFPAGIFTSADVTTGRFGFGKAFAYFGNYAFAVPRYVEPTGVSVSEGYAGIAFYIDSQNGGTTYFGFYDAVNDTPQFTFGFHTNGIVKLWRGFPHTGTLLGASEVGAFLYDSWFYFDIHGIVNSSSGYAQCRINTVPVLTAPSINTQNTALATLDSLCWGTVSNPALGGLNTIFRVDDLYFCDTAGTINNGYLGNVRVPTQFASGAGASTQFSIGGSSPAATNWQSVLNTILDDTKYVYDLTAGQEDLYTVQAVVNAPLVHGLQIRCAARQDDATQRVLRNVLKAGATTVTGVDHYLNQTYAYYSDIWELDPDTGIQFTGAQANAIQIGPKVQV